MQVMIQGTSSDAGKSTLVTALCRIARRRGLRVAPFKPQNMSLNSAPTIDGGEIGRAQALQAQAAGIVPHSDMNPLLLKPESDTSSQVIVQGKAIGRLHSKDYLTSQKRRLTPILESYHRLRQQYDCVIVEGAGSPAEINLRSSDVANMGFAEAVDCPVVLVGNIDKGGVFAQFVGTLELLSPEDRSRIVGMVINGFRGDASLLTPATTWLERHTERPLLGIVPYITGLFLDAEDALVMHQRQGEGSDLLKVCVPALPRISNHTDFDPLRLHPKVDFSYVPPSQLPKTMDLLILPGSKNVQADLQWLRKEGWEPVIQRHLRYGGRVLGICGGYQMLGKWIHDPMGIEGNSGSLRGLGFLDVETSLTPYKRLKQCEARFYRAGTKISGYEIHCGISSGPDCQRPFATLADSEDGARSSDEHILGTYLHGLFESPCAAQAILEWAGLSLSEAAPDIADLREASINQLADIVETVVDVDRLFVCIDKGLRARSTGSHASMS